MSDVIAEMILPAETLQQYVDVFTPLVQEGKIHFNDDGLTTRVVEPANVSMIAPATLDAAVFESYDAPGAATIAIDFTTLDERLGPANAGDLVHLAVDMETGHLRIEYDGVEHTVAMIDPDSVRQEPDMPELDLPNTLTVTGAGLDKIKTHAKMVSTHLELGVDVDAEEFYAVAPGDVDDVTITFGNDDLVSAQVSESTESMFSLEYFEEVIKPIPNGVEVTLTLGEEFPVVLEWEACDGYLDVTQMIAPRIRSN